MKGKIPPASVMRSVCSLLLLHYTHVQIAAKFGLRDSTLSRYKAQLQKAGMYSPKQLDAMGGPGLQRHGERSQMLRKGRRRGQSAGGQDHGAQRRENADP